MTQYPGICHMQYPNRTLLKQSGFIIDKEKF